MTFSLLNLADRFSNAAFLFILFLWLFWYGTLHFGIVNLTASAPYLIRYSLGFIYVLLIPIVTVVFSVVLFGGALQRFHDEAGRFVSIIRLLGGLAGVAAFFVYVATLSSI